MVLRQTDGENARQRQQALMSEFAQGADRPEADKKPQQARTVSKNDEQNEPAKAAAPPQRPAAKEHKPFSRAQKHSRRVRFLKIFLPAAGLALAAVFSWFTFFAAPSNKAAITINSGAEEGRSNRLVMTAPKVEGYTKDNRPYALKAEKAIQDPEKSGIIELQNIAGTVPLGSRGAAQVAAAGAFFDNVNGRLRFDRPLTLRAEDGASARLLSADVNMQSGQLSTDDPVEIKSATQNLTASSMRVTESGRVIRFGGRVHIVVIPAEKPQ